MWTFSHRCFRGKRPLRGFTLVELMAVVAIVMVVSGVLLFNNNRFNSSILLRSLAYQIGLSVRQAQLYGVAVKGTSVSGSLSFASPYGVHFDDSLLNRPNISYPLFVDTDADGRFTSADTDVEDFTVRNGFVIQSFCTVTTSSGVKCAGTVCPSLYPSCLPGAIHTLDISFKRPNPDAIFKTDSADPSDAYTSALITVISPTTGIYRSVSVSLTGQINVEAATNAKAP